MKEINRSENGSIIIVVLVVLVVVSMYGIASLNSSSTELTITRNGRCYKQNVYRAEAAIMEVAKILDGEADPVVNLVPGNMPPTPIYDFFAGSSLYDPENDVDPESLEWIFTGTGANVEPAKLYTDDKSGYTVAFQGLAPGSSFNMNNTRMWQYGLYGVAQQCEGNVGVVAGYRRRF